MGLSKLRVYPQGFSKIAYCLIEIAFGCGHLTQI